MNQSGSDNPNWGGGKTKHPLYDIYMDMVARCRRPTHHAYARYGGRGIYVCDRWVDDFWNFIFDMGDRPEGLSLDRVDNDGPYSPGNCRWATASQQMKNRRSSGWAHIVKFGMDNPSAKLSSGDREQMRQARSQRGESVADLAVRYGVTTSRVYQILREERLTV